ncbi:hypothetical protein LCGC14_1444380 [marine sediment metagenome]|uniref:Uncharacterized protein n=1 Tax=marine sediment metagenome TaxID=412755 RepID=A0A0F9JJP0_9ZZZZ
MTERVKEWKEKRMKIKKLPTQSVEEIINQAMMEGSNPSGLPKDWKNRILRNT